MFLPKGLIVIKVLYFILDQMAYLAMDYVPVLYFMYMHLEVTW